MIPASYCMTKCNYILLFSADVDECSTREQDCARRTSKCVNKPGSYECRCINGYAGDGKTCTG